MKKTQVNIKDVALAAGVSVATVSRVSNGKPVKSSTRERVLKAMKELRYVPNVLARGLVTSSTKTVGVLISDISDVFFSMQLSVVETELRKNDYNIIVVCINDDMSSDMQKRQVQFLLGAHVAGIVFIGPKFHGSVIYDYLESMGVRIPLILLNDSADSPNTYCIIADDKNAVCRVTQQLYKRGRRHFLYLYDRINPSGIAKLQGFKKGLLSCGINFDERKALFCKRDIEFAREIVLKLLHSGTKIDAIITSQDELAIGALKAAISQGIKIPDELAIVGYNNSILAQGCIPALSSIDNNVQTLSEIAIKTFFDVVAGKKVPQKILISCNFIERETT